MPQDVEGRLAISYDLLSHGTMRQLQVLREIVANTANPVYLLDEWDANLDAANRCAAVALIEELARHARVIEVSHHDMN